MTAYGRTVDKVEIKPVCGYNPDGPQFVYVMGPGWWEYLRTAATKKEAEEIKRKIEKENANPHKV